MNHFGETDLDEKKKLEAIKNDLREKEEELEGVEDLQQTLVIQEHKTNDELQDARKKLIIWIGVPKCTSRVIISVKRMGDLDIKPFRGTFYREHKAAQRKIAEERRMKALQWYSQCEDYLRDLSWHPFKIVTDKEGNSKGILDENDEKLKSLKDDLGDEVHDAVISSSSANANISLNQTSVSTPARPVSHDTARAETTFHSHSKNRGATRPPVHHCTARAGTPVPNLLKNQKPHILHGPCQALHGPCTIQQKISSLFYRILGSLIHSKTSTNSYNTQR
ncbi:hypothetical protein RYX36_002950 [Vicia faba]